MQKNNLLIRRFAIDARRALLNNRKADPKDALRFFSQRIAVRFLESNRRFSLELKKGDTESSAGFAEICGELAGRFPLFSGKCGVFNPKLVPVSQLPSSLFDLDCGGKIETLGRLFEYFRTEERESVCAEFRNSRKPEREKVYAATQLFTPDWILRYLVENSLGRYFSGTAPTNIGTEFLSELPQTSGTEEQLRLIRETQTSRKPESIRLIDPCMGCGHILLYAFDLFLRLYQHHGREKEEAAVSILRQNLYGYELDPDAAELARFSLALKAMAAAPHLMHTALKMNLISPAEEPETRNFGSLLSSGPVLSDRYDIVVTNPPYLGRRKMNRALSAFIRDFYPAGKPDIFAAFMERCADLTKPDGWTAMITPQSWMFLTTFEEIRRRIFDSTLISLLHLGPRVFDSLGGEVTQTAAFVTTPARIPGYRSRLFRLVEGNISEKEAAFQKRLYEYRLRLDDYRNLPGMPIPYLLGKDACRLFRLGKPLRETANPCQGLATTDNSRFLRLWYDTDLTECGFGYRTRAEAASSGKKWFPYNKGGDFRRWYGNQEYLIDWESDGERLRAFKGPHGTSRAVLRNQHRYFQEGISWSKVTGGNLAVRYIPPGFLFDVAGCSVFYDSENSLLRGLGFLNSAAAQQILTAVSPTLNYEVGQIGGLPVLPLNQYGNEVEQLVRENIDIARSDWDSFETSWGFRHHPFLDSGGSIESAFRGWSQETERRSARLRENEERLDQIFFNLYRLKGNYESTAKSPVRLADWKRDLKSFLSYVIGILTGRYSLDEEGIQFAGGRWEDFRKSSRLIPQTLPFLAVDPQKSENDLVQMLESFLKTIFPKTGIEENLRALQNGLGETGCDPRETLRRYFLNRFAGEHAKIYKNKPVYKMVPGKGIVYRWRNPSCF